MAFAVIGKGSLAASFNCAYIFTGELFPTVIRWVQRNPLPCAKAAGHGHIQALPPPRFLPAKRVRRELVVGPICSQEEL